MEYLVPPISSGSKDVDVVVTAVNDNPRYLKCVPWWFEFWKIASEHWPGALVPVLLKFGDTVQASGLQRFHQNVVHIDVPTGIPSALASQVGRVIWPSAVPSELRAVITTDVDMFPINTEGLAKQVTNLSDRFVVFRNVLEHLSQFPICYSIASPDIWKQVVGTELGFNRKLQSVLDEFGPYDGRHGGVGWSIDQRALYQWVTDWEKSGGSVLRLTDRETNYRRLDRAFPQSMVRFGMGLKRKNYWSSYHAHLPPERYEDTYRYLIKKITESN